MKQDASKIFTRYKSNPVLSPDDYPGIEAIFNPGVAEYKGKTILAASVVRFDQYQTDSTNRGGITCIAESEDGINFKLQENSFIELETLDFPFNEIYRHTIDNRITQINDKYYMITPTAPLDRWYGPVGILGYTKDFKDYTPVEVIALPSNRGISLFPEKINGEYYRLDRPMGSAGRGHIWLSSSPDLIYWGKHRPVLAPYNYWNADKIGPTPPIKTPDGWLTIIHGVRSNAGGTQYYIGAVLLDLEQPWQVIGKTASWLLAPEMPCETDGICPNVVFPCGALANEERDEIRLYYGAADTRICLATGKLSSIIRACVDEI
jgi:predicted GH43/DUF377 family glycosyl hydrolase